MNGSTQEEDQAADQVCNDRGDDLAHCSKKNADTCKDGGTGLPPEQVECVPLEIDPHILSIVQERQRNFCPWGFCTRTLYPAAK
jgi:hypothetical protein